jgi:hypothetical protein
LASKYGMGKRHCFQNIELQKKWGKYKRSTLLVSKVHHAVT